jgi:hypothetical protein
MRSKLRSSARGLPRGSLSVCASLVSCFMISLSRATTTLRASDSTRKGTSPMSQTCSRLIHTTITIKALLFRCRAAMGAVKMFSSSDLRPTIEITEFILVSFSTIVIAVRSVSIIQQSISYPIVLIAIRFYARGCIVGRVDLSDYIMSGALVS